MVMGPVFIKEFSVFERLKKSFCFESMEKHQIVQKVTFGSQKNMNSLIKKILGHDPEPCPCKCSPIMTLLVILAFLLDNNLYARTVHK